MKKNTAVKRGITNSKEFDILKCEKIRLNITKNDIQKGVRCSPSDCPIGLSFKRFLGNGNISIYIAGGNAIVYFGNRRVFKAPLSLRAKAFISNFDNQRSVEPFKLTLKRRR